MANYHLSTLDTPPPSSSSSSSDTQPKAAGSNALDPRQFVAKVVSGVTEQLKHDFPRMDGTKKDYTPPLVRRFTVPYPSSNHSPYYNLPRPQ